MDLIYKRYIFKTFIVRFSLILFLFFCFYLLIDFALNIKSSFPSAISLNEIAYYYFFELIVQLELLIPLAFILSLIQTLFYLNNNLELVAFQASGLSKIQILRPIHTVAWWMTILLFLNTQLLIPKAESKVARIQKVSKKSKELNSTQIFQKQLNDQSLLIYSEYKEVEERFEDVYWILSRDKLWHFEFLEFEEGKMIGYLANYFEKKEYEGFGLVKSHEKISLLEMPIIFHEGKKQQPSLEFLSFTQMLIKQVKDFEKQTLTYHQVKSRFWHKLILPFFTPLLFYLFSIPCMHYNRQKKSYKTIALGIFTFVSLFTLFNALSILSEHHVLPAAVASIGPFMLFGLPSIYRYLRS
jgi:lipopolysaccharide export LptBFGC system permease protein LptF